MPSRRHQGMREFLRNGRPEKVNLQLLEGGKLKEPTERKTYRKTVFLWLNYKLSGLSHALVLARDQRRSCSMLLVTYTPRCTDPSFSRSRVHSAGKLCNHPCACNVEAESVENRLLSFPLFQSRSVGRWLDRRFDLLNKSALFQFFTLSLPAMGL